MRNARIQFTIIPITALHFSIKNMSSAEKMRGPVGSKYEHADYETTYTLWFEYEKLLRGS